MEKSWRLENTRVGPMADISSRDRILDAALEVLADDGLAGFTHRRIEERAGVSHGSTTYHFGSRDALFDAVVERLLTREAETLHEVMAEVLADVADGPLADGAADPLRGQPFRAGFEWTEQPGRLLMYRYTRTLMSRLLSEPELIRARFEIYLHASRTEGGLARLTESRQEIYRAQAAQAATLGYPDPALYARAMVALIDGISIHHVSVPDPQVAERAVDAVLVMLRGLYASPTRFG